MAEVLATSESDGVSAVTQSLSARLDALLDRVRLAFEGAAGCGFESGITQGASS